MSITADLGTILVADDEPDLIALVSRRLTRTGYTVITAVDGEDALRTALARRPDLALLDVMMPVRTGLEVSRMLRDRPDTHQMPVILMSAGLVEIDIPDDADAFIVKPFGALELPALVHQVLSRGPRRPLPEPPTPL